MLAFALTAQAAETCGQYSILDWEEISESIEQCLHCPMPSSLLLGSEDAFYISPTQADIEEMVAFAIASKEPTPYVEESWDCDNFAREAKHWMDVWALRHYRHSRAAVAVGIAYVKVQTFDGTYYHVMNVIRRNDGQWFFFEPQDNRGKLVPVDGPLADGTIVLIKVNL